VYVGIEPGIAERNPRVDDEAALLLIRWQLMRREVCLRRDATRRDAGADEFPALAVNRDAQSGQSLSATPELLRCSRNSFDRSRRAIRALILEDLRIPREARGWMLQSAADSSPPAKERQGVATPS